MKRLSSLCVAILVLLSLYLPINAEAANIPTRAINVVYDDSGSMYADVDTWCQAKYSMEVFAAMLGEADTMNVYYMSDYEKGTSARPRITLDGFDGAEVNVAKVHNEKTVAGNTPFNSVKKAYADLQKSAADEKWLVILTDGEFQGIDGTQDIDNYLAQKPGDINVMYLGMGSNADAITEKQNQGIFYVEAGTSRQILNNITDICTRIFNSHRLEIDTSTKTFSFDVPMGELIVFAQGANIALNGIKNQDGKLFQSFRIPVEVKYSECDATNYDNAPDKNLLGIIAAYRDDFVADDYSIDISGAETIEVYYKPNVEVAAHLTDGEGNVIADFSSVAAGEYTLSFFFVKAGTGERVSDSELLGDVSYSAVISNNGVALDGAYTNGDKITIEEGTLTIDVTGHYLDYNTVKTHLAYDVFRDKEIAFFEDKTPSYTVVSEGFTENEPIRIKAKIDGRELTKEQWAIMDTPQIVLADDDLEFGIELSEVKKGAEPGTFEVSLMLPDGKPTAGTYCDIDYQINYRQQIGSETWQGSSDGTIALNDTRPWWERNWARLVKLIILLAILFVLAGYLPFIKHYLPKSLKKKPKISCIPNEPGESRKDRNGSVEKNIISSIIPYVPQTGTIKYVPRGVTGCPALAVRAIKRRRMTLTNAKAFIGRDYITFNGASIREDTRRFDTDASVIIRAGRGEWTYVCSPNQ